VWRVSERTLNLGILAHVDAGKTTLTERLLHAAGVIDEIGSVDAGTTQTDSLELERRRGITIKAAVVSFAVGDVKVNLIDTPGHPDFIAEVERTLSVLDGVVLVVSAVEGVQSQTLVLMRALQRLRIPTVFFLNKLDRAGADVERTLRAIAARLTPAVVPMQGVVDEAQAVEVLAERDDELLAAYVEDGGVPQRELRAALASQTREALVHPVFAGSAITGEGVDALAKGVAELLPPPAPDPDGPAAARVFKIERAPSGEKVAYVRMFSGRLGVRERVGDEKVTALSVFDHGADRRRSCVVAGEIAKVWGLGSLRIGDAIGDLPTARGGRQFAPPAFESVIAPVDPADGARLRVALAQLAEQDPLIGVRGDHDVSVSLYGEVQKEVLEATLAEEYGIAVTFQETTTIHVERPLGAGHAVEILHADSNPFNATVGLRVEPALADAGIAFRSTVDADTMPLYVYKSPAGFVDAMESYVREALAAGLYGWRVTDCVVTLAECGYSIPDGPPSRRGPKSTAADFRKLTPVVLRQALADAGTVVCRPMLSARLEVPAAAVGLVLPVLMRLEADVQPPSVEGAVAVVDAVLPAAHVQELRRLLPGLTGGEGALETELAGYEPVSGAPPVRA
jgi:ribosomal protection tetracycline resistance protein